MWFTVVALKLEEKSETQWLLHSGHLCVAVTPLKARLMTGMKQHAVSFIRSKACVRRLVKGESLR